MFQIDRDPIESSLPHYFCYRAIGNLHPAPDYDFSAFQPLLNTKHIIRRSEVLGAVLSVVQHIFSS